MITLSGDVRPFKVQIMTTCWQPYLELEKECRCTFLCFNRPRIDVRLIEPPHNEGKFIGAIVQPWKMCDLEV